MKHDQLQQLLHDSFDPAHWARFQKLNTGPKGMPNFGEIDLFIMNFSYSRPDLRAYEVKVTQADFDKDVKEEKFHKYLPYCKRFFFAIKKGIKWKDRVGHLPEVGVILYNEDKGWRVVKSPQPNRKIMEVIPEEFWKSIIFNKLSSTPELAQKRELEVQISHLKSEFKVLQFSANKRIREKSLELLPMLRKAELTMKQAKLEVMRDITMRIGGNAYGIDSVDKMLKNVFFDPLRSVFNQHFIETKEKLNKEIRESFDEED